MTRRRRRPGRKLRLEVVPHEDHALDVDVRKHTIDVAPGTRAFVFVLRHEDRLKLSQLKLEQMAQVLGNLVYPHSATLLVAQPSATLEVYEVVASGDTERHAPSTGPGKEVAG